MGHHTSFKIGLVGLMVMLSACGVSTTDISSTPSPGNSAPTDAALHESIAFVRNTGEFNTDLFVMDSDGLSAVQLTQTPDMELFPAWSPDGTQLAFSYAGERDPSEGWPIMQVYTMRADGNERTQRTGTALPTMNDLHPRWSPDGTRIAYVTIAFNGIWTIDLAGSVPQRLTPDNSPHTDSNVITSYGGAAPAWSSDGSHFLISGSRIVLIKTDGTLVKRLTNGPLDQEPAWSPDGKRITFVRHSGDTNETPSDIFIMDADGSNITRLTNTPDQDHQPAWSPDGTRIVFAAAGAPQPRPTYAPLPTAEPPTAGPAPTTTPFPAQSPIGQRAYPFQTEPSANTIYEVPTLSPELPPATPPQAEPPVDSGYPLPADPGLPADPKPQLYTPNDIFVINVDGTGLINLTNSPQNESYPAWRPQP